MHNRIIVLAPHPDDGEFGAGGTLKKLAEEGREIWYVAFSPCDKSLMKDFEKGTLYKELPNAMAKLGIPEKNIIKYDYPVREFSAYRQDILETLVLLREKMQPDLVLLPNSHDIHQDHKTIHEEGIRAFKHTRIIGYELPWNNFTVTNNFHVKLQRPHITAKIAALREYKSQYFRPYMNEEFFYGLARTRGTQVNSEYAEAFEAIRWFI